MRYFPDDEDGREEAARLEAPAWMVEQLRLNPGYVSWGPHEDYMWVKGEGWNAPSILNSWGEFGPWGLDDLNEIANFYFEVNRPSRDCDMCAGKGAHPDAQWITESWYHHSSPFTKPDANEIEMKATLERFGVHTRIGINGRGALPPDDVITRYGKPFLDHCVSTMENGGEWCTNITQDEADALWNDGRLWSFKQRPTAAEVNAAARKGPMLHDGINSWICQRTRCERLGVPYECPKCEAHGHLFTGHAYLTLVLWFLHPRKGCSRGVEVNHIQETELPDVYRYLRKAADRNAERFSKVPASVPVA